MTVQRAINENMDEPSMTWHLQSVHNLCQVLLVGHDLRQILVCLQHHRRCNFMKMLSNMVKVKHMHIWRHSVHNHSICT